MHTAPDFSGDKQVNTKLTFVERIRKSDGSPTHLIKSYNQQNEPCWFLLKANERWLAKLENTSFDDLLDLNEYGEVVASGWGHEISLEDAED
jgi:hypothetical protein